MSDTASRSATSHVMQTARFTGPLSCSRGDSVDGTIAIVELVGELDLSTSPLLASTLESADRPVVVVDLRQLEFIDVAGVRALLTANASAETDGRHLVVIPAAVVHRVLRLAGADHGLTLLDPNTPWSELEKGLVKRLSGGRAADRADPEADQAQSDADQAESDADQGRADEDQRASDRDQHASDRDQVAADWHHRHTPRTAATDRGHRAASDARGDSTEERASSTKKRALSTAQRLAASDRRDANARIRDVAADARDRLAAAGDRAAEQFEQHAADRVRAAAASARTTDMLREFDELREATASVRRQAAQLRAAAAADRASAAADRQRAAAERTDAGLDELTGVLRRGMGEAAVLHEMARARRLEQPLVLAMIDVDLLKDVNDAEGHAAGDALLRDVATAIISTMREYDIAVRWGGDEFLSVLSDATLPVASARLASVQGLLSRRDPPASISVGLAELSRSADETLSTLLARADAALYKAKAARKV